jgi:hypothetical protein
MRRERMLAHTVETSQNCMLDACKVSLAELNESPHDLPRKYLGATMSKMGDD